MGEAELIKQCMRGVNAARKELYDTYAEQMLSICFRYTGGMDVAYDLLHDGFLKVFSSCSSFFLSRRREFESVDEPYICKYGVGVPSEKGCPQTSSPP